MLKIKTHKKYIFNIIFLLHFIVFAISPLSYSFTAKKNVNFNCLGKTPYVTEDINIFFWELIFDEFLKKDISHSNSTTTIPFRKARAILSEDINTKIVHFQDLSVAESYVAHIAYPLTKLALLFDGQDPLDDQGPLHSGPSPPSV